MDMYNKIQETCNFLKKEVKRIPDVCIILGSGLADLAESIKSQKTYSYSDIPNWASSTVAGHEGRLIFGTLEGCDVVVMQGRTHYYEGYSIKEVTFPVRVLGFLGIKTLILTNASGGVNIDYNPGTIVVIKDHINFMGTNPLIGSNIDKLGPRFPDMTQAYDNNLIETLKNVASSENIKVESGVYMAFSGPSFETPSEIQMARFLGADLVGMSTVPEVIVANHMGIKVCAISCVSNAAAGITGNKLTHQEVMENMNKTSFKLNKLIKSFVKEIVV